MNTEYDEDGDRLASSELTLRDYFAAKAMAALICSPDSQLHQQWPTHNMRSDFAYEQADSMLKARKQ